MKELFDRLDLGYPGLERVRAAVERGDQTEAGDELLAYHQARRRERCLEFWDMSGPEDYPAMPWGAASSHEQLWKNDPARVLEGVLFASGQVFDFSTDRAIDWTSNTIWAGDKYAPVSQPRCMLRRMYWLRPLDLGFLRGDAETRGKAARQFARLMESWLAFEKFVSDEFVLQRAIRIGDPISQSGLTRSWQVFLPPPLVPKELKLRLLLNIAEGADEVLERAAWHPWAWGLAEASGLGYAGILFPEFKRAPVWRERCFGFANRFFQTELRSDGTLKRMHFCPHYTGGTAAWPLAFYPQIAKLGYDDVLEPGARTGISRLADWTAAVLKPDNTVPQITASDIQGFGRWLRAGAATFRRPDWLHVATAGREGTPPAATSVVLPDAGAFILRDGYSRDSMVACLHNGDYHNTERTNLAIDLYALGRTLVTAPGRYGYYTPEWLPYFATAGYNSLMVDGSPHQEWGEHPLRQGPGLTDAAWRLDADSDWAWGSHPTGFDAAPAVRWQRGLLFVKGAYWLVVDRVTGPGEHSFSLRWLLTPSKAVIEPGGLNVHTEEADASVLLAPSLPPGARLDLREGCREPLRGWYSPENGTMIPSPQLEYTWTGGLPTLAAMLIVPYRGERPDYSVAIERTGDNGQDVIVRGPGTNDRLSLDFRGAGSAAFVRR
jgi:heparan-sulfate lyase